MDNVNAKKVIKKLKQANVSCVTILMEDVILSVQILLKKHNNKECTYVYNKITSKLII